LLRRAANRALAPTSDGRYQVLAAADELKIVLRQQDPSAFLGGRLFGSDIGLDHFLFIAHEGLRL